MVAWAETVTFFPNWADALLLELARCTAWSMSFESSVRWRRWKLLDDRVGVQADTAAMTAPAAAVRRKSRREGDAPVIAGGGLVLAGRGGGSVGSSALLLRPDRAAARA